MERGRVVCVQCKFIPLAVQIVQNDREGLRGKFLQLDAARCIFVFGEPTTLARKPGKILAFAWTDGEILLVDVVGCMRVAIIREDNHNRPITETLFGIQAPATHALRSHGKRCHSKRL